MHFEPRKNNKSRFTLFHRVKLIEKKLHHDTRSVNTKLYQQEVK